MVEKFEDNLGWDQIEFIRRVATRLIYDFAPGELIVDGIKPSPSDLYYAEMFNRWDESDRNLDKLIDFPRLPTCSGVCYS